MITFFNLRNDKKNGVTHQKSAPETFITVRECDCFCVSKCFIGVAFVSLKYPVIQLKHTKINSNNKRIFCLFYCVNVIFCYIFVVHKGTGLLFLSETVHFSYRKYIF